MDSVACQAPLSMGFSRQEYWSGLPFPSPVDLPNPGIEATSLMSPALAGRFFTTGTTWESPKWQHIKKQRHYFADKGHRIKTMVFSNHVRMWELDHKESWVLKNWCFWTVVLEKILESPLDCKEIKPVHPKGNQSWIFIGRTGAEAEAPILWPPDVKNGLIGKDLDAGKDWGQENKGVAEDEVLGWHHWLKGHMFAQTLRDSEGQGSLACCSPWVRQELNMT